MPINLEEHTVFIDRLQMDMVPLSVAKQAIAEAYSEVDNLEQLLQSTLTTINKTIEEND